MCLKSKTPGRNSSHRAWPHPLASRSTHIGFLSCWCTSSSLQAGQPPREPAPGGPIGSPITCGHLLPQRRDLPLLLGRHTPQKPPAPGLPWESWRSREKQQGTHHPGLQPWPSEQCPRACHPPREASPPGSAVGMAWQETGTATCSHLSCLLHPPCGPVQTFSSMCWEVQTTSRDADYSLHAYQRPSLSSERSFQPTVSCFFYFFFCR